MRSDKKMEAGRIKFILLREIGSAEICRTLTDSDLLDAVQEVVRA